MKAEITSQQAQMNAAFRQMIAPVWTHAERDVRVAQVEGDRAAKARAQARLETLKTASEIYAAAHFRAYGDRPWPYGEVL